MPLLVAVRSTARALNGLHLLVLTEVLYLLAPPSRDRWEILAQLSQY